MIEMLKENDKKYSEGRNLYLRCDSNLKVTQLRLMWPFYRC